jgi:hypothetical protein
MESERYELTPEVPNVLVVKYEDERVAAVEWHFYLD